MKIVCFHPVIGYTLLYKSLLDLFEFKESYNQV